MQPRDAHLAPSSTTTVLSRSFSCHHKAAEGALEGLPTCQQCTGPSGQPKFSWNFFFSLGFFFFFPVGSQHLPLAGHFFGEFISSPVLVYSRQGPHCSGVLHHPWLPLATIGQAGCQRIVILPPRSPLVPPQPTPCGDNQGRPSLESLWLPQRAHHKRRIQLRAECESMYVAVSHSRMSCRPPAAATHARDSG